MKLTSLSFNRQNLLPSLKKGAKTIIWFLAQNAFLFILFFILLEVLLGQFLFYQYVSLPKIKDPEITQLPARFKKETYQSVQDIWKAREMRFNNIEREKIGNPF